MSSMNLYVQLVNIFIFNEHELQPIYVWVCWGHLMFWLFGFMRKTEAHWKKLLIEFTIFFKVIGCNQFILATYK